jgi:toxin ParE1/3/4
MEWTNTGRDSLYSIAQFIAEQNQSIERALRVVDRVEDKCKLLAEFPMSGMPRPDLAAELRSTLVDTLVIIYRPLEDGIRVILVAEGHQDLPSVIAKLWF